MKLKVLLKKTIQKLNSQNNQNRFNNYTLKYMKKPMTKIFLASTCKFLAFEKVEFYIYYHFSFNFINKKTYKIT